MTKGKPETRVLKHKRQKFLLASHGLRVLRTHVCFAHSFVSREGSFVPWAFRSKYMNLFRLEPEIYLADYFFYSIKERNNSLFLERNDCKPTPKFKTPCSLVYVKLFFSFWFQSTLVWLLP